MIDGLSRGIDSDETTRASVIASYDADGLDPATGGLDEIAAFAAALCDAPVALITLVEREYQRFLARVGTDLPGVPRGDSFCTYAIESPEPTVVPDARADPRFASYPQVTGAPFVRFYAGTPLISPEGVALGTLCVLDVVPRAALTPLQQQGLAVLANAAMGRLGDRRAERDRSVSALGNRRALEDSESKFRTLADTMPQMVWSTRADGFHDYYNARWYEFIGAPVGSTDGEGWSGMFHPDDQERAWAMWTRSLATGDPYGIEYRLRHHDGSYRWVLGRALPMRDGSGAIIRWFGTCTDIHEQKLASEEREVISQELSHRIKNIFAVIAGLVGLAARNKPEFAPAAADLRQRITALGRAHDFVRPHSAQSQPTAAQNSLFGLLADLFEPYQRIDGDRVTVSGNDIEIDDRSATPLALLFHELATNATKYGALSTEDGTIEVTAIQDAEAVSLSWRERGGPPITGPSEGTGFGSQLIELSAVRQLGGRITRDWRPEGLVMTIEMPLLSFNRRGLPG